ncbi:MAG: condensation domain-containing protein [Anaerolineales bacterium]|nr:condensation domain-containing protein [Anaerolineales bacterium]
MEYKRKVTRLEEIFLRAPYSVVTMVARIKGNVTENMLRTAVVKVQQRHTNLRVRIEQDQDQNTWFTSKGVKEIPIEIMSRKGEDHWIEIFHETCKKPFKLNESPAIRFILVQSPTVSELVIFCHHIICDGLSLAYLARDIMAHLGDPARETEILSNPVPIDKDNLPTGLSLNRVVKFFVERINKKWEHDRVIFDQEDYETLSQTYWSKYKHQMVLMELSEQQTSDLVERCRREQVTVNSALSTAFVAAQTAVQGEKPYHSKIGVAGNLRDRLKNPAGEIMGFFAGLVSLNFNYQSKTGFWENTRKFHLKIQPLYTNKNLFQDLLVWCYLSPGILESLSYKMLGKLVSPQLPRYQKLSEFSKRDDVISSMLKREKMDSLDQILSGTAITNLTRMDFPRQYGELELDRLIMNPGGAYPLVFINLVVGAVTCSGKLSVVIEYAEDTIDTPTVEKIKTKAMDLLFRE